MAGVHLYIAHQLSDGTMTSRTVDIICSFEFDVLRCNCAMGVQMDTGLVIFAIGGLYVAGLLMLGHGDQLYNAVRRKIDAVLCRISHG